MNHDSITPEDFFDRFCPVLAYDPEHQIFELEDKAVAFGFMCQPLAGWESAIGDRLSTFLAQEYPVGTLVQIALHAGPDIQPVMFDYVKSRDRRRSRNEPKNLHLELAERQEEFINQGIDGTLINSEIFKPRNLKVIVTVRMPTAGTLATEAEREFAAQRAKSVGETLRNAGLHNEPLKPAEYIRMVSQMINWQPSAEWRHDHRAVYDENLPIREQFADPSTMVEPERSRIVIGDHVIKTLSMKRNPDAVYFGFANQYLSDPLSGSRGIKDYCLITLNVLYGDPESDRARLELESTYVTTQTFGILSRINPRLGKQKQSFDAMQKVLGEGDKPIRAYLSVILFADKTREQQATSNAIAYLRECGFVAMEDVGCCLPQFLNAVPLFADPKAARGLRRYHRMATRHATALMPIFGDWKGNSWEAPICLLSRKGQLMGIDMFAKSNNAFNGLVVAETGAGKSFLTNEIAQTYNAFGGRVWILDAGKSYERMVKYLGGQYLEFSAQSNICINPFPTIKEFSEEADILLGILMAMAYPTPPQNDTTYNFQIGSMRMVLGEVWRDKGQQAEIQDVVNLLAKHEDARVRDLAVQMYPFTAKGEYGRFFNGPNTLTSDSNIMVIELEHLKSRRHLQRVVLLQMMNQIATEMFLKERTQHRLCIIDEAWDLLAGSESGGSGSSEIQSFINAFYRKLRKHGAGAIIVTQTLEDVYASPIGAAIAANTPNTFILKQKGEIIDRAKEKRYLALPDGAFDLLKTVHTRRGSYAEILAMTGGGAGIGRLIVPRYKSLLYTTDAQEGEALRKLTESGLSIHEAIVQFMAQQKAQQRRAA